MRAFVLGFLLAAVLFGLAPLSAQLLDDRRSRGPDVLLPQGPAVGGVQPYVDQYGRQGTILGPNPRNPC